LFEPDWGERCCNNVKYVKKNAFFEQSSMKSYSITPQKQNQDFLKGHNRTPLIPEGTHGKLAYGLPYKLSSGVIEHLYFCVYYS